MNYGPPCIEKVGEDTYRCTVSGKQTITVFLPIHCNHGQVSLKVKKPFVDNTPLLDFIKSKPNGATDMEIEVFLSAAPYGYCQAAIYRYIGSLVKNGTLTMGQGGKFFVPVISIDESHPESPGS